MSCWTSLFWALVLAPNSPAADLNKCEALDRASARATSGAITVDRLLAAHAEYRARLTAVNVVDVVRQVGTPLESPEQSLARMYDTVDLRKQTALRGSGLSEAQVADQFAFETARVPAYAAIGQLNFRSSLRRTCWLDFERRRARIEQVDLRDVQRLAEQHALLPREVVVLDQSRVIICLGDYRSERMQFEPALGPLALLTRPGFEHDALYQQFGLLPTWVNPDSFALELGDLVPSDADVRELVGKRDGAVVFRATVERPFGWRLTRFVTFSAQGNPVYDTQLADWRTVDFPIDLAPHDVSFRATDSTGRDLIQRRQRIELIRPIPYAEAASVDYQPIPHGWRMQDLR